MLTFLSSLLKSLSCWMRSRLFSKKLVPNDCLLCTPRRGRGFSGPKVLWPLFSGTLGGCNGLEVRSVFSKLQKHSYFHQPTTPSMRLSSFFVGSIFFQSTHVAHYWPFQGPSRRTCPPSPSNFTIDRAFLAPGIIAFFSFVFHTRFLFHFATFPLFLTYSEPPTPSVFFPPILFS